MWERGGCRMARFSPIVWTKKGEVLVKLRLSINTQGTPMNLFSTALIDPDLPQTLGRRMWMLALGNQPAPDAASEFDLARIDALRNYDGFVSLNDYKDWVLNWPETDLPRPRVCTTREAVARIKANLDRCPGKEAIKDFYLLTGSEERARADAERLLKELDDRFRSASRAYTPGFRQIEADEPLIFTADSCLSAKSLPPELRAAIRAKCAAIWHLTMHPNYYPRGAGVHLGNPNMTFNRSMGIPMWAALLQDHPRAKPVLEDMAAFTRWLTEYNVTPAGGVFRDSPHYATYGPALFITKAAIALRNAGYDITTSPAFADLGRYFTSLESSPAPLRLKTIGGDWRGRQMRHLPAFGNGRDVPASQSELQLAALMRDRDPGFASEMMGAFAEARSYLGTGDRMAPASNWFYWDPSIEPRTPARGDSLISGFGGVLRAHVGTPAETYVALRSGYVQSHWGSAQGSDQGTFVLYAGGANLCPGTGWMYSEVPEGFCHDSRLTFGAATAASPFGFVDTNIEDYGFLPSVSYLVGRQPFKAPRGGDSAGSGSFAWRRHVLLMPGEKPGGPTYAVMRDTIEGSPTKSWWHQWVNAPADRVERIRGGVRARTAGGVDLDVLFAEPMNPEVTIKGTKVRDFDEDYTQLTLARGSGESYLAVFFPHVGGKPAVTVEPLVPGVVKVTTNESTDYIACGDAPIHFKSGDVEIAAHAGAVRVFKDKVLLVNASGRPGSIAWKGVRAKGEGPFEHVTGLLPTRSEVVAVGRPVPALAHPDHAGTKVVFDGSGATSNEISAFSKGLNGYVVDDGGEQTFVATRGIGEMGIKGFWIRGEAPFIAQRKAGRVTLQMDGRRRVVEMAIPPDLAPSHLVPPYDTLPAELKKEWIIWPCAVDVQIDGVSRQGGWYDGVMSTGVPEGRHTVVFRPYTNPPAWRENAFTRLIREAR